MVKSPAADVDIPRVTAPQFLLSMAETHEDKTALINGVTGESYTFADYSSAVKRVASALFRRGIGRGHMVALHCENRPEFSVIVTAVLCTGATLTPASTAFVPAELQRQLADAAATYLFTSEAMFKVSEEAAKRYGKIKEIFVVGRRPGCTSLKDLMADDGSAFRADVDIDVVEDVALVQYSSGTTGFPKGVMITHYNIIAVLMQFSSPRLNPAAEPPVDQIVLLGLLPCYHVYGMFSSVIGAIAGGVKVIYLPRFHPESFFKAIEKYKIKQLPLVPALINFMSDSPDASKYDLSSLERVSAGAAPLSRKQEEQFRKRFKVDYLRQGYGLTEATGLLTLPALDGPYKPGTVGEPIPNTEMKVIDVETSADLGPNQRGEILARGPQIMKGYLNRPAATAGCIDADGWFHSGDIGYYDDDGLFYIVDRIKELIKYKGLQVAPAELEALLLTHESVQDCGVVGVPDADAGELPKAFIVTKPGHTLTAQQVHEFMKDQVASYKSLRGGVEFVAEIPRTLTGKILRRVLKEQTKGSGRASKL